MPSSMYDVLQVFSAQHIGFKPPFPSSPLPSFLSPPSTRLPSHIISSTFLKSPSFHASPILSHWLSFLCLILFVLLPFSPDLLIPLTIFLFLGSIPFPLVFHIGRLPVPLSKRIEGGFSSKNPINAVSIISDRGKFNSRSSRPPSV
jgi:hypothetical protein